MLMFRRRFRTLVVALAIAIAVSHAAFAATFHAILVTDVDDKSIGESVKVDLGHMKAEVLRIVAATGMGKKAVAVSGANMKASKIMGYINNLSVGKDDTVLFYYSGHGERNSEWKDDWPHLYFPDDPGLWLDAVILELQNKAPRLTIIVTDSCNIVDTTLGAQDKAAEPPGPNDGYKALFLESEGRIIAAAASQGETAVGDAERGGLFTSALLAAIGKEATSACPSWDAIVKKAGRRIVDGKHSQTPVIAASISRISPAEKAAAPVCEPPEPAVATTTLAGGTTGYFEGRTGHGEISLEVDGTRVRGRFKGETSNEGAAPENGRRVEQPDGTVVTTAKNPDGTTTTVTQATNGKVIIAVLNKDGSITTTVQTPEGLSGEYGYETRGHHPQHPDRHYSFSQGEWHWDQVTFEGQVADALFNAATGTVRGTLRGQWKLSTEKCGSECGPTTGPARASFSGRIDGSGFAGQIAWTLSKLKDGAVTDHGGFETSGGSVRTATRTPAPQAPAPPPPLTATAPSPPPPPPAATVSPPPSPPTPTVSAPPPPPPAATVAPPPAPSAIPSWSTLGGSSQPPPQPTQPVQGGGWQSLN
jgi:hypothetical protein